MTDQELYDFIDDTYRKYVGRGDYLTDAIGSLVTAHFMGWRVLLVCTSEPTFRKHEKILGIKFKEVCDERGRYSRKSLGLKLMDKLNNFWNVIQGRVKMNREDRVSFD